MCWAALPQRNAIPAGFEPGPGCECGWEAGRRPRRDYVVPVMAAPVTTDSIWGELDRQLFAVLGMVNRRGEARTSGIVFRAFQRKLYIGTEKTSWKAKHVARNPHVSMTVCIPKRVPFMPFIPIPAATITCNGSARVLALSEAPPEVVHYLLRGLQETPQAQGMCIIEVTPHGDFVTYGVGVSLLTMRKTQEARGRAPVA